MNERNQRSTGGLPPLLAIMLFLTSTTGNALAADDKACSQQERTNKTLSEKLDQTAGVICPPTLILPSRRPHPTPGTHRLSRHRAARVAIRPSSLSDLAIAEPPRCLILQLVGKEGFQSTRSGSEKESPAVYARLSVEPETQVGLAAPVSPNRLPNNGPTSSSPAGNADDATQACGEAGTTCCLAIAVAPSAFLTQGKGRRRAEFSVAAKDLRCGPERLITEQKLGDNPIVDWGFRYRSTRKPRLSCHRRTPLALMERFQT